MTPEIKKALEEFCRVIENADGVVLLKNGLHEPHGDRAWLDLGEAYIQACKALGRKPVVEEEDPYDEDDGEESECGECGECGCDIPQTGGSLANKHHQESCSLYDPDEN